MTCPQFPHQDLYRVLTFVSGSKCNIEQLALNASNPITTMEGYYELGNLTCPPDCQSPQPNDGNHRSQTPTPTKGKGCESDPGHSSRSLKKKRLPKVLSSAST